MVNPDQTYRTLQLVNYWHAHKDDPTIHNRLVVTTIMFDSYKKNNFTFKCFLCHGHALHLLTWYIMMGALFCPSSEYIPLSR